MATPADELADAVEAMQQWGSLSRRLNSAQVQAKESAAKAAAARDRVAEEYRDVEKLESLSFTKILAHLKGSHSDDLARETAEHQAAEYEYLTLQARADADQRAVENFTRQLATLGNVQARYRKALAVKEKWLIERDDPAADRLCEIAEQRGRLEAERVEIDQAISAGENALEQLRAAADKLDSARSWSAYDTWLDGGILTSMVKHNRLDDGAAHMRSADAALRRFATELADVNMAGVQALDLKPMMRTFDVWLDNIFNDLAVRSRIIESQESVAKTIDGTKAVLEQLRARGQNCADKLARLQTERASLVES